jgi:phospholipase A-2-activating protein
MADQAADAAEYKLYCELRGHDEDVRGLSHFHLVRSDDKGEEESPNGDPTNTIRVVTASRDKSIRVWRLPLPQEKEAAAQCEATLLDHTDYVTSVRSYANLGDDTGNVVLSSGSRDMTGKLWRLTYGTEGEGSSGCDADLSFGSGGCLATFLGHKYQVTCSLVLGRNQKAKKRVATASLDGTIRVFDLVQGEWENGAAKDYDKPAQVLSDHEGPVLCLCELADGTLVSGSGDASIRLWERAEAGGLFRCKQVYKDHTDSVRSLAAVPHQNVFFSASHDTTLRSWNTASGCQRVFVGHSALIYDVKAVAKAKTGEGEGILAVSASEDCTCRVWDNDTGECLQVLEMPGCVWSVDLIHAPSICAFPLLAAGTSDGVARIFAPCSNTAEEHLTNGALVAAFDAAVEERKAVSNKAQEAAAPDGLRVEEKSALNQPGVKDGQVKTVKEDNGKVFAYQWSVVSLKWECVGEVVVNPAESQQPTGGPGTSSMMAPHKMVDGVHYDYVFDVDVQDGVPPLKLPYNKNENPYEAADRFILANSLPMSYREQVVQFIIQNTGGQAAAAAPATPAIDPTANFDPYAREQAVVALHHVPLKKCLAFEQCQKSSMLGKVREFNSSCASESQMNERHLASIDKVIDLALEHSSISTEGDIDALIEGLNLSLSWEKEKKFPIFDLLRIILLSKDSPVVLQRVMETGSLFEVIIEAIKPPRPASVELTVLRMLCNASTAMPSLVQPLFEPLLNELSGCCKSKSKHVRLAWSTFLLNCSVLVNEKVDLDSKLLLSYTFQAASDYIDSLDVDSAFRVLVGLGTLMKGNEAGTSFAKWLGLEPLIAKAKQLGGKISEVSSDLQQLLK